MRVGGRRHGGHHLRRHRPHVRRAHQPGNLRRLPRHGADGQADALPRGRVLLPRQRSGVRPVRPHDQPVPGPGPVHRRPRPAVLVLGGLSDAHRDGLQRPRQLLGCRGRRLRRGDGGGLCRARPGVGAEDVQRRHVLPRVRRLLRGRRGVRLRAARPDEGLHAGAGHQLLRRLLLRRDRGDHALLRARLSAVWRGGRPAHRGARAAGGA
mmetsp:Transcript_6820/g.17419  ORF Transcript_6820/g.17419 Transcript_6820/m.17419 type:complete len:209 (+) Transcript_6820:430-1056(+)